MHCDDRQIDNDHEDGSARKHAHVSDTDSQLSCRGNELLLNLSILETTNKPLQCFRLSPVHFFDGILFSYQEKTCKKQNILGDISFGAISHLVC